MTFTRRRQIIASFFSYAIIIGFLLLLSLGARFLLRGSELVHEAEFQFFVLGILFFVAYCINRLAPRTVVPSFVWAIFAGMAAQPLLSLYTHDVTALKLIMELFAAFVLFAGGLDIPFKHFKKWFLPIASLSFVGVLVSAVVFAFVLYFLSLYFGYLSPFLMPSIIILSAALASTDPTAIIPTMQTLRFKRPHLKQIAVAESALTDVSGSVLTRFLLIALVGVPLTASTGIFDFFAPLFSRPTYEALALQIVTGIIVGYIGYVIIRALYKPNDNGNESGDPALLLSVPIFTFVIGNMIGGAGFLASFVSGLFSDISGSLKKASHFYASMLDHLMKPFIFIVLGALVPFAQLMELAPMGIIAAFLFMFFVRPIVVGVSLLPWVLQGAFTFRDLLFLSFIRETGIIAAILIVISATSNIISSQYVIAIGMWVILLTLIVEPPLTPMVARAVGVADKR